MKKIIAFLLFTLLSIGIGEAQIVRSESRSITVEKTKYNFGSNWLVKAGVGGIVTFEEATRFKYNVLFGYQRQFYRNGMYWGAQAGLGSFLHDDYPEISCLPDFYIGPTIGLKRPLGTNTTFDTHLGVGYSRLLSSSAYNDDYNGVVWEYGAGIWHKRFLIEIEYQGSARGFGVDFGFLLNLGMKF